MSNLHDTIHSEEDLRQAITMLETKQNLERKELEVAFVAAFKSMQPINIIKDTLQRAVNGNEINSTVLNKSVGFAVGYVSKKIIEGTTFTPLRKVLGAAVMMGVSSLINHNPQMLDTIKKNLSQLFNKSAETKQNV